MSARTRPARKAAQTVSYAYDEPASSEDEAGNGSTDEDDDDFGRAGKRSKGAAKTHKKRKVMTADSSESDSDDETMFDAQARGDGSLKKDELEDVEYEVKRVDFSKVLPVETLAEIFSHLHPASLLNLLSLSRSFRTILKSTTLAPVWRAAMRPEASSPILGKPTLDTRWTVPKVGGEDMDQIKLAAVMFDKECEYCGERNVARGDRYLLVRLCVDCRTRNLISVADVPKDKAYQDLHPATLQCIVSTPLPPHSTRWARSQRSWVLPSDLLDISESLEELQLEDDADADGYCEDLVDAKTVQKGLSRAKRLKRRWYGDGKKRADAIEKNLVKKYTPRVREFVLERKELQKDRIKLAEWIEYAESLYESRTQEQLAGKAHDDRLRSARGSAVEQRVAKAGVFKPNTTQFYSLRSHSLVDRPEPLTDDIWNAIAPAVNRFVARNVAQNIFAKCSKKNAQDFDSDDEDGLLKKPKTVTKEGWKYVRPELVKLAKEWKVQVKEQAVRKKELKAQAPQLKPAQIAAKDEFFRDRYDKAFQMSADKATGNTMPRYGEFLLLPTVAELYADRKFANSTAEEDREGDIQLWGDACLDDVLAEMASYAIDTRCEALRLILAATTELGDALDDFDLVEALQDQEQYGEAFFARASSYVSCGLCFNMFGPLGDVLAHVHKAHPLNSAFSAKKWATATSLDDFTPKVDLSLEVACAWSALLDLAGVKDADRVVKKEELDKAFKDKKLVWENGPRGTQGRSTWDEIIPRVTVAARAAHASGDVLDVPVIARKDLSWRERWRASYNWPGRSGRR
ncbi:hypothetical protein JCM10449v2_006569 [Rhodotorula kratochvilovae]